MGQVGSEGTREVGSPSQRDGKGREALLEGWEGWGGKGGVGRLSRRAGSGQEALLLVEEALSVGRVWSVRPPGGSGGPPTGPGVVRRPFQLARSGLEAFPVGR